jgi:hypothetical protein
MARAKPNSGGEGKTPLVIGLVFFVLATIVLGVLAYTFQGDIAAAEAKAAEAKKDTELARGELSKSQDLLRLHQVILGHGTEEDRTKLSSSANKEFLRDEHAKIMARINGRLQTAIDADKGQFVGLEGEKWNPKPAELFSWPWPNVGEMLPAPTPGPLVETIVKNRADREMAMRKLNTEKKSVLALEADLKLAKEAYETEKAKYAAASAKIPAQIDAIQKLLAKDVEAKKLEFTNASAGYRGDIAKAKGDFDLAQQRSDEIGSKLKNIQEQLDRELTKQADKEDPFAFDNPKGAITATFNAQNLVEINLGSADNARPGLTFNVQPREVAVRGLQSRIKKVIENGKYVERMVPKAKVEIIEVLGPNLSRARVTEVYDPIRESILKGDILYNAAWRKGSVDHVVLYGIFDIDGDGVDDIKVVARALAKMGIIVDGYYDLSSRKWVGNGPTDHTAYAVEGATPSALAGDGLLKEKGDLINSINAAREEARKKGAKAVRYRDFFPRIGYTVKYDVNDEQINQAAAKFLRTNVVPEGEPK